jgi:hypothetical protein
MLSKKNLAVGAALLLGSASMALAGGRDGRGRDATRYERSGQPHRHAAPRTGAYVNSSGPGAPAFRVGPSADEQRWMERASRVSESAR